MVHKSLFQNMLIKHIVSLKKNTVNCIKLYIELNVIYTIMFDSLQFVNIRSAHANVKMTTLLIFVNIVNKFVIAILFHETHTYIHNAEKRYNLIF